MSAKGSILAIAIASGIISLLASGAYSSTSASSWSLGRFLGSVSAIGTRDASAQDSGARHIAIATGVADDTRSTGSSVSVSSGIPASLFGLTVLDFTKLTPSISFGTTRTWDAHPDLDWSDANPYAGVYNFKYLDQFIAMNEARGTDIIYTFGRTPRWASSQPNTPTPYGPGECAPPADIGAWDDYVTAIATYAAGRIKYWELWNEPNVNFFYCGDIPTMVIMAQHAAQIIKTIDPAGVILSPSAVGGSGPAWLGAFLSGGGATSVDVIAFHGYASAQAEDVVSVISAFSAVASADGAASKPLWDTESSWAGSGKLPTPTAEQQVAFIAKDYLLHWSQGVSRFVWYAYDGGPIWGGFLTSKGTESSAVTAYKQTYAWLVGAKLVTPCSEAANHVWTCGLSRPGGYTAKVIWISNQNANYPVPGTYLDYRDLAGLVHPITKTTITISDEPILLETAPLPE